MPAIRGAFNEEDMMSNNRSYALAAYIVVLGLLTCFGWLFIGHSDDAPGAGMIGFAALLSSLVVAFVLVRRRPANGRG